MCIGIGIIVVVPEDGSPIQIFGRSGNSSHDTILHEMVPVELHNRVVKIEYTYPHALRLDAPDEVCRRSALDLGIAEMGPFGPRLTVGSVELVQQWISAERIEFDASTLQFADFRRANLSDANLSDANLRYADLSDADLSDADLYHANLYHANLYHANLSDANLRYANLRYANLYHANLSDADLSDANLTHANLYHADLYHANLSDADLTHANLRYADLTHANLSDADLYHADLRYAVGIEKSILEKMEAI